MIAAPQPDEPSPEAGDGENLEWRPIAGVHEASTSPSKQQYAVFNDDVSTPMEP
jgi:hypothetical protein